MFRSTRDVEKPCPGFLAKFGRRLWRACLTFLELIGLREDRRVDQEAQLARFRLYHTEFRNLLTANNSFLETLSDLEAKRSCHVAFDHFYVERSIMRATVDIHRMVESLNGFSNQRYDALRRVRDDLTAQLTRRTELHTRTGSERLTLDLDKITAQDAGLVGGKMANLGEIRNRLGLATPDGFALTTDAYRLFVRQRGLQPIIQSLSLNQDSERLPVVSYPPESQDYPDSPKNPEAILFHASGGVSATTSEADGKAILEKLQTEMTKTGPGPELEAEILAGFQRLSERMEQSPELAVRSSALGEDSELSYAGQYATVLHVKPHGLRTAYLQVLASLFAPDAVHYRRLHRVDLEAPAMAVGFVAMVDALVSGVMFTRDPARPESGEILIHMVPGLGVALVDGQINPEVLRVAREDPAQILAREDPRATASAHDSPDSPIPDTPQAKTKDRSTSLTDEETTTLTRWGLLLETHFCGPQDVEWALDQARRLILLQARPLRVLQETSETAAPLEGVALLLSGGDVAFPGIGVGVVVMMDENSDLESFPPGAVLVAPRPSPRFVRLMDRARAIVTDVGSTTGHMASLAREFRIPTLLNTHTATRKLSPGTLVTVDAIHRHIYQGEVPKLENGSTEFAEKLTSRKAWLRQTPAFQFLDHVAELILPLNLTDPRAHTFLPESCRTLHDIARFVHERSFSEMFRMGEDLGDLRTVSYYLDVFLAIDLYIIDLGQGLAPGITGRKVKPAQITSVPLKAMVHGMLDRKIQRFGPKQMDLGGFFNIMMRHAVTTPEQERTFQDPSYALISDHYLNYTARVGYHFGVVDAYCGRTPNKNYISMQFRGGAADAIRRSRRSRAIAGILRTHGFLVEVKGDAVSARFTKASQPETFERLEMLGRLLQFVRQLDVAMVSEESVHRVREAFFRGDYDLDRPAESTSPDP